MQTPTRIGDTRPLQELSFLNRADYSRSRSESMLDKLNLTEHKPVTGIVYQAIDENLTGEVWISRDMKAYGLSVLYQRVR